MLENIDPINLSENVSEENIKETLPYEKCIGLHVSKNKIKKERLVSDLSI